MSTYVFLCPTSRVTLPTGVIILPPNALNFVIVGAIFIVGIFSESSVFEEITLASAPVSNLHLIFFLSTIRSTYLYMYIPLLSPCCIRGVKHRLNS